MKYSHYCLGIVASRRMGAREVVALSRLIRDPRGAPPTCGATTGRSYRRAPPGMAGHGWRQNPLHRAGSPWPEQRRWLQPGASATSASTESCSPTSLEAQSVALAFGEEYNDIRPHSTIDYRSPSEYRAELLNQAPDSAQARQAGPSSVWSLPSFPPATTT